MTTKTQRVFDDAVHTCRKLLGDTEAFVAGFDTFLKHYEIHITEDWTVLKNQPFDLARTMLASSLINVVVCGEFSSGKSFLISSLIDELV